MAGLCRPAVALPEYVITMEEALELARRMNADNPQLSLALRPIPNTGMQKRHIVQPIEETLSHPGFEARNPVYEEQSKERVPEVIERALANAQLGVAAVDAIPVPGGWPISHGQGGRQACLDHVGQVWTDMRPTGLREQTERDVVGQTRG